MTGKIKLMTIKQAFFEKLCSDMLYYENLLRQAKNEGDDKLENDIIHILCELYKQVRKNHNDVQIRSRKNKENPQAQERATG